MPPSSLLASLPSIPTAVSSAAALLAPSGSVPMTSSLAGSSPGLADLSALPELSALPPHNAAHMLPPKLVKRIQDLEYIDMSELVQDAWQFHEEEPGSCCHAKRRRRGPVSDILVWVDCYSSLVAVLSAHHPDKTPQFMAYLKTIVYASKSFSGDGWVTYDACYRRKAATTRSLDWSRLDFTLYNQIFAGRAKALPRCRYCNSELHKSADCPIAPDGPERVSLVSRPEAPRALSYVCQLFNSKGGNRCHFQPCKFRHSCAECGGSHPASLCRSQSSKRYSRRESPQRTRK